MFVSSITGRDRQRELINMHVRYPIVQTDQSFMKECDGEKEVGVCQLSIYSQCTMREGDIERGRFRDSYISRWRL